MSKKTKITKCKIISNNSIDRCKQRNSSSKPKASESFVWKETNWRKIEERLNIVQCKIYAASKENNIFKVRKLQKTLLNSYDFKKFAVRKVTQLNRGKKTPGVDGISGLNERQRVWLVDNLKIRSHSHPVRRVMIPKPNGSLRPLGIPTMYDRALQALFVMALEPEFEAKFEENSYGFRPGRSPIDAMKQIQLCLQNADKFVLDADIEKCFDKINHEKLLDLIGHKGKVRTQIQAWLESGNIFEGMFELTEAGTPQGGVISPLLSNIALDGIEKRIGDWAETRRLLRPSGKPISGNYNKRKSVHFIRYADDFVVMNHDLVVIRECQQIIGEFLAERSLELSKAKTNIVHTRFPFENNQPGFEFLGFKIKHFNTTKHSAKDNQGRSIGYRLLIFPSRASRKKHFAKVDLVLRRYRTARQSYIIGQLRPIIVGWTNYFRYSHLLTTKIGSAMEQVMYKKLLYWGKRKLNAAKKSTLTYVKFWHKINGRKQFAYKNREGDYVTLSLYRKVAKNTSLVKYVKVKGDVSTYNGDLNYWSRRAITPDLRTRTKAKLLKRQDYKCSLCLKTFMPGDEIETDHIKPIAKGGSHKLANLQLLHAVCHDYKEDVKEGCDMTENLEAHHINPIANLSKRKDLSAFEKALIRRKRKTVMLCKKHHNLLHKKGVFITSN